MKREANRWWGFGGGEGALGEELARMKYFIDMERYYDGLPDWSLGVDDYWTLCMHWVHGIEMYVITAGCVYDPVLTPLTF